MDLGNRRTARGGRGRVARARLRDRRRAGRRKGCRSRSAAGTEARIEEAAAADRLRLHPARRRRRHRRRRDRVRRRRRPMRSAAIDILVAERGRAARRRLRRRRRPRRVRPGVRAELPVDDRDVQGRGAGDAGAAVGASRRDHLDLGAPADPDPDPLQHRPRRASPGSSRRSPARWRATGSRSTASSPASTTPSGSRSLHADPSSLGAGGAGGGDRRCRRLRGDRRVRLLRRGEVRHRRGDPGRRRRVRRAAVNAASGGVRHVVLFTFRDGATGEQIAAVTEGLAALPAPDPRDPGLPRRARSRAQRRQPPVRGGRGLRLGRGLPRLPRPSGPSGRDHRANPPDHRLPHRGPDRASEARLRRRVDRHTLGA